MLTSAFIPAPLAPVFNQDDAEVDYVGAQEDHARECDVYDDLVAPGELAWEIMTADPMVADKTVSHRSELGYSRRGNRAKQARRALARASRGQCRLELRWIN